MSQTKINQPRINLVAGAILIVVTLLVGLTVFVVMQRHSEMLLSKSLQSSLQSSIQQLMSEIQVDFDKTELIATRPHIIELLQLANARTRDANVRNKLNIAARSFLQTGIAAIAVFGKDGEELIRAGNFTRHAKLAVPLNFPGQVQLMWDGQLILRTVVEIKKEGKYAGRVMTEMLLPHSMDALNNADRLGKTGEQALCAPLGLDSMQCFPTTLNPRIFTTAQKTSAGVRLPMTHAFEGETGFITTKDYRRQTVVAAYAPLGDLGLGMVLKMDRTELYAPVWQQLSSLIPFLLGVFAIALLLLRWLLAPLVARLVSSEDNAVKRSIALGHEIAERKQIEHSLRASEERFKTIFVEAPLGIALIDSLNGLFREVNPRFAEIAGRSMESMANIDWLEITHPDDVQADLNNMEMLNAGKISGFQMEKRYIHPDGIVVWVDMTISPLKVEDKEHPRHLCMIQDITERKSAEARIKYLNRVYALLSDISALIVRVQDRDELFREACKVALDTGGFQMSMLCMVNQQTKKIVLQASAGKDKELLSSIEEHLSSSESAAKTMVGQAIREKRDIVSNDALNDHKVLFAGKYAEYGVHSMIVLPLLVSNEAVGILALYAGEIDFFHEEEIKLLRELVNNIALGIDHIDKQEKLNYLAYYDVLTGLPSRPLFQDRLNQALTYAYRHDKKLALMLLDLDDFKNVNDSLGHNAGDQLLKQFAARLEECLRESDTVARLGGDEFVVILPIVVLEDNVTLVTQKFLKLSNEPFVIDGHELFITCSIGISFYPKDGEDAETLLKNADAAMYRAKDQGRNNAQFCNAEMNVKALQRLTLENNLRHALKREEFLLHYQPRVDMRSGEITGMEALVRWQDPEQGLIPPGMFIPAAEISGLIVPLGTWVLHTACAQNKAWQTAGFKPVCVAVNLSARQFAQQDLVELVTRTLQETGLDATYLELELTESMIMHDAEATIATLNQLKAIGVKFSIDDFGTGYSSLSYLKRFPINFLKIDQSFVRDITTDPDDAAITRTIISIAHDLGHKVIAEGVETEEQKSFLQLHHCDEMQGYLFSKPVTAEQFGLMLSSIVIAAQ